MSTEQHDVRSGSYMYQLHVQAIHLDVLFDVHAFLMGQVVTTIRLGHKPIDDTPEKQHCPGCKALVFLAGLATRVEAELSREGF